jgi:NitT/TauT family transport system substrate-binding protein
MTITQTRRQFLTGLSLTSAVGLLGARPALAAEAALETTSVRITKNPGICYAPEYVAEELLRDEGFTDIRYVDTPESSEIGAAIAQGKVDFGMNYAPVFVTDIDAGASVTVIGGVMVGCTELFAREGIRSIAELKGKRVGQQASGSLPAILVVLMAAQVGLDPNKDIDWVTDPKVKPKELFSDGKIDAFVSFPPEAQELRARGIGHVIVATAIDRPWSQYYCCMLGGNPEYVRKYPVATKRALRAVLKAADLCATDPAGTARRMVDRGFTPRYDYAVQTLSENSFDKWREYDPEDTMRFYALRLHDAGLIKTIPTKIIAENTDWRFFNELKRELKA